MTAVDYAQSHAAENSLGLHYTAFATLAPCRSITCTAKMLFRAVESAKLG
jgi:hypothetical protein